MMWPLNRGSTDTNIFSIQSKLLYDKNWQKEMMFGSHPGLIFKSKGQCSTGINLYYSKASTPVMEFIIRLFIGVND